MYIIAVITFIIFSSAICIKCAFLLGKITEVSSNIIVIILSGLLGVIWFIIMLLSLYSIHFIII